MEGGKIVIGVKDGAISGYPCYFCKKARVLYILFSVFEPLSCSRQTTHIQRQNKTKDDFSRSQWRRHAKRRCRECVLEAEKLKDEAKKSKLKKIQAQRSADLAKYQREQKAAGKAAPTTTGAASNNEETIGDILTSSQAIVTCEKVLVALSQDLTVNPKNHVVLREHSSD